jgi:light-regulated signal transduction histidine kinase (bacteriophytochrome)
VAIAYALVAALPPASSSSIRLPGGQVDTSSFRVPDRDRFEPICIQALSTKDGDPTLRDKCVAAYQIWGARSQRAPLTVMRATVDVVLVKPAPTQAELHGMARDIQVAVDQVGALIEALLTLARNGRGLATREDVDLATIAEDVLDSADPLDRRPHPSLRPALTSGDPVLLERLIANLVDNAVRYNAPGGGLWVTTSTVDGQPTVAVANTGR